MRLLNLLLLALLSFATNGQQSVYIKITGGENKRAVAASILLKNGHYNNGVTTDSNGVARVAFPTNALYIITVSAVGYEEKQIRLTIPASTDSLQINLENAVHEMEEVIVSSTRTSRTIANVPTRVETIALEEIDEKNNMRPSNVAMLLHESTGIQVQQTSATSGNASIRIQGLDGRYTQLLKDGFANFGNFSSGLSVLEIPPLDLKQVEIIKGPASTLYGGGAIAGVVNFISKTPTTKPAYQFILNQSNIGQSNIGGFASARTKKIGYTLLALYNKSSAYDADKDDFTEVPKTNEVTLHPKVFFYPNEKTTIIVGNSFTSSERTGGDIQVIKNSGDATHQYFEKNKTLRNISTLELDKNVTDKNRLVAKQSLSIFDRSIAIPAYTFSGIDCIAYTDLAYISNGNQHSFVVGANIIYNRFNEKNGTGNERDNSTTTGGIYAQHTWDASNKIKLESGLRIDAVNYKNALYRNNEVFVLPRISFLFKYSPKWSSRIGGGMGYKTPTLFTEETETIQYKGVAQLSNVQSEKSYGGTADINFNTQLGNNLVFTFNHMFFYTLIDHPLVLQEYASRNYRFFNAGEPVKSAGFETNARFVYKRNMKLFLGYTYTDSRANYRSGNQILPLIPRSKLNTALIYEKESVIKVGLEAYFTGRQYLNNGNATPGFSEFGLMAEKTFRHFSLFVNFENFTDTRQSRYKNVVNGSHLDPTFDEIWTHTEGFVVNGGVKIRF